MRQCRFPPPWTVEECWPIDDAGVADLLQSVWLGHPSGVYMGGLHHVAREASLEAKDSNENRNGIGGRWGVVASQAAHPRQPLVRQAIHRRRTRRRYLLSVRKKSRTSAWRPSMSSTMKTPEHIAPAYNLPRRRAATEEAKAAQSTEAAEAAQ